MGISYMIPGLCSASMGITLGVYEDIIEIFSSFYKVKTIKKHLTLIIGIVIGLVSCMLLLSKLLDSYTNFLSSLFVGFVISDYVKNKKIKELNKENILCFIIGIIIVLFISIVGNIQLSKNINNVFFGFEFILLSIISILSSLALILPGISGSMILYVFGIYEKLSKSFESMIYSILNSQPLIDGKFWYIVIFFVSFLVGILVFSKIIDKFLKLNNNRFIGVINGFLIGSMLILIYEVCINIDNFVNFVICLVLLLLGILVSIILGKKQ